MILLSSSFPKWFDTMLNAFGEMERRGFISVDKDRFMQIYANKIGNEKVRSAFLIKLLDLTLKKGYTDNFPAYVESIRSAIIGDKDQAALKELEVKYAELKEANKSVLKGMPAPEFTAVDVNGKEYKLSDFAGKVVVLDFWFTGCIALQDGNALYGEDSGINERRPYPVHLHVTGYRHTTVGLMEGDDKRRTRSGTQPERSRWIQIGTAEEIRHSLCTAHCHHRSRRKNL